MPRITDVINENGEISFNVEVQTHFNVIWWMLPFANICFVFYRVGLFYLEDGNYVSHFGKYLNVENYYSKRLSLNICW